MLRGAAYKVFYGGRGGLAQGRVQPHATRHFWVGANPGVARAPGKSGAQGVR